MSSSERHQTLFGELCLQEKDLDRKSLSELAISNPEAFKAVFDLAKKAIDAKDGATLAS